MHTGSNGSLTKEQACRLFRYDSNSGKLYRNIGRGNTKAGDEAGTFFDSGSGYYKVIRVGGRLYYAHRIVWLINYGQWPRHEIDHIDGDGLNNRLDNLRDVDRSVNNRNRRMQSNNTTGLTGVRQDAKSKRWSAHIKVHSRQKYLGSYKTKDEAVEARAQAEQLLGFTPRHGARRNRSES